MFFIKERIGAILKDLEKYVYPKSEMIHEYLMKEGAFKGGETPGLDTADWERFTPGQRWGGKDRHYWFRASVEIPAAFEGNAVAYTIRTGKEGLWDATNPQLLVYVNGEIVQGMDINHTEIILTQDAKAGEVYHIALYAYGGMLDGLVELESKISTVDRTAEKLYYDMKVPLEIASLLEPDDKKRIDILNYLNEAVNLLDLRKPFSLQYAESLQLAVNFLEQEFYGKYCGGEDVVAHCVGHTHIDVAWLWTLAQTREKTVRSFSTVLNLMKEYPEYIFMSSQPQLYKYLKEEQPEMYEQVKQRVREGRWEAEGAMWLEADCNLASGEALVRQVLFGTRFFQQEFGVQNKILWLPDVFGYSAALPQILKKSGIDYFMTTKISWSEYNKMPCDTFMWRGLDGTEILTYFITTSDYDQPSTAHQTTYVGHLIPKHVMGAWKRYQQKDINEEVMICYGYGDGGGGPTKQMLEYGRRMEKGIPGCPKVQQGTALDYFKRLEQKVMDKKKLPGWVGELYLELHRGTYTSMARNKKYNRKSELLYQDAECFSVVNQAVSGASYPQDKLNQGWETILLNQFHDILPGSSIKEVYDDSENDYKGVLAAGGEMLGGALEGIAGNISIEETSIVVFNQLGFVRSDVVEVPLPEAYTNVMLNDNEGHKVNTQLVDTPEGRKILFFAENVPAKGYKVYRMKQQDSGAASLAGTIYSDTSALDNRFYNIRFDESGNISSIMDKTADREVLKAGEKANVLQAFEDKPREWDAWEISIYYQEKMWQINQVESIEVIENGPVRAGVRIRKKFLDSAIVQDIYIYNDIQRIDFKTWIDWKEKQILLKAAFPVDVHTDKATYDVQFGNVERATHWNTSWDYAKFEVCAHKWADLSEADYGVSLLNDCKYGYDIKDGVMRLTLLTSGIHPNPEADQEQHQFTYSLYPHEGDWKAGGTVQEAYALNCPMYAKVEQAHEGSLPPEMSFVSCDRENVVMETVKKAEDSGDIIVGVHECYNKRSKANISFMKDIKGVWECDLMENRVGEVVADGKGFSFEIKPYEIRTFKVKL